MTRTRVTLDGLPRFIQYEEWESLRDAMWQLLVDLGEHGTSVCLLAKAEARIAFEPFALEADVDGLMLLEEAQRIVRELT